MIVRGYSLVSSSLVVGVGSSSPMLLEESLGSSDPSCAGFLKG